MRSTRNNELETTILRTIRYFDVLGLPVTALQVWRALIMPQEENRVRWGDQALYSLRQVQGALQSLEEQQLVEMRWGYFFLLGQRALVRERLHRQVLAQRKWRIARQVVRWLIYVPFIKMIAGSGSLALDNTRPTSDLDVFIIVEKGRIWTARLLLLCVTQLTGRRRKYWDRQAPDKICLNHYISDANVAIAPVIRNVHTAVTYTHLVPLFGQPMYKQFQKVNAAWMKSFLMYPDPPFIFSVYQVKPRLFLWRIREQLAQFLLEPIGQWLERQVERWQRQAIARHTEPGRGGRVFVSDQELAFHPDSKVPSILQKFYQDPGQGTLL
jgi:hypothetical protein